MIENSRQWAVGLVVTVMLSVAGIVASIYGPGFSEKSKALQYSFSKSVLAVNSLVGNPSDLVVSVRGRQVKNLRSFQMTFFNSGAVPIAKTDFEGPIEIKLPAHAVVSFPTVESVPKGIPVGVNLLNGSEGAPGVLQLSVGLLNPEDKFVVSMLLDGQGDPLPEISARISGVSRLTPRIDDAENAVSIANPRWLSSVYAVAIVALNVVVGFLAYRYIPDNFSRQELPGLLVRIGLAFVLALPLVMTSLLLGKLIGRAWDLSSAGYWAALMAAVVPGLLYGMWLAFRSPRIA